MVRVLNDQEAEYLACVLEDVKPDVLIDERGVKEDPPGTFHRVELEAQPLEFKGNLPPNFFN